MDDEIVAMDRKKKSDIDLINIIQCYDSKQQKFKFGDHEPKAITSEDVVEIFGLNNQGVELPNTDKSTKNMKDSFVKAYFAKQKIDIVEAYQKSVQDKTPEGAKATASIICYWICLHTNLVETISGRENMIPAIGRWDIMKIHKAIRDIRVEEIEIGGGIPCFEEPTKEHSNINQEECNAIPYPQQNNESSKKKKKKTT
ncbi:hypothetical protein DVH24_042779 [Malus domestica]|uniref:Aminotransferase-like plant mobile domain-containing protein n=1 Tax=Malus domestica TaxID=3750 RepID=A0A498I167_MALDO|nr:hypothetical protein DVH24_042779 [Malus domestica]